MYQSGPRMETLGLLLNMAFSPLLAFGPLL